MNPTPTKPVDHKLIKKILTTQRNQFHSLTDKRVNKLIRHYLKENQPASPQTIHPTTQKTTARSQATKPVETPIIVMLPNENEKTGHHVYPCLTFTQQA